MVSTVALQPFSARALKPAFVALAGFLLPLQTVWILRPGMLGGVPWPLATIGVYASDVVLFIAAMIGVVCLWRGGGLPPTSPLHRGGGTKRGRTNRRFIYIGVSLLFALAIVNSLVSADPWLSAVGWVRIILFLLVLIGVPAWSTPARRAFLGGFIVAMIGHVILGFAQFATGHGFASTLLGTAAHDAFVRGDSVLETAGGRWLRAYGGFPHPNVFGTALLVALVALARRPVRSFIIHHSSFIILTLALVLSFSRSAWLGFLILLFVLARTRAAPEKHGRVKLEQAVDGRTRQPSTRSLAAIGAVAFIAFLLVLWPLVVPRFSGSTPNEQRSLSERTNSIRDAVSVLPAALVSPGHGLHALPAWMYERYGSPNPKFFRQHLELFQPVHNVPFLMLIELGGIGTFVLVLVLVLVARNSSFLIPHSSFLLALAPSLLLDHHLWSLPIGLAFLFALSVATTSSEEQHPA